MTELVFTFPYLNPFIPIPEDVLDFYESLGDIEDEDERVVVITPYEA